MITALPRRSATQSSTPTSKRYWGIVLMLLIFSMLNFADKAAIGLASKPIRESMGLLMFTWILTMLPLTVPTTFGVLFASRIALGFFEGPAHAMCQSIVHGLFPPE